MGLLARLFLGSGELPGDVRARLTAEGITHLEEGLRGSITYRDFHAPGRSAAYRRVGLVCAFAVTGERLYVSDGGKLPQIDIAWKDPAASALRPSVEDGTLRIAFDAGAVHPDQRGRIEVALRCADPSAACASVTARAH